MKRWLMCALLLSCSDPITVSDSGADTTLDSPIDSTTDAIVVDASPIDATVRPSIDGTKARRLCELLDTFLAESGLPGGSIGVSVVDGGTHICIAGVTDTTSGAQIAESNRFRIGSVTKTFVMATVLLLAEEGALSLSDTLDMYFGGFQNNPTLSQLMNHTSGLGEFVFDQRVRSDDSQSFTEEELLNVARSIPPELPLATRFSYSNTNYFLLGAIISQVSGRSWAQEVRSRISEPLGFEHTFVEGFEEVPGGHIRGYEREGDSLVDVSEAFHPTVANAAGCMLSNTDNLLRWGQALYNGGILNQDSLNLMNQVHRVPHAHDGGIHEGNFVSLANFIETDDTYGDVYGHSGGLPGFSTNLRYLNDRGITQVIQLNGTATSSELNTLTSEIWGVMLLP